MRIEERYFTTGRSVEAVIRADDGRVIASLRVLDEGCDEAYDVFKAEFSWTTRDNGGERFTTHPRLKRANDGS